MSIINIGHNIDVCKYVYSDVYGTIHYLSQFMSVGVRDLIPL